MARRDLTGAVNFTYLNSYVGDDQGIVAEVLDIFEQQAEIWLKLFRLDAPDEAWRDAAHTMKGAALGVGATELASACSDAELNAAHPATRAVLMDQVLTNLNAVLGDIAAWKHEQLLQGLKG